MMNSRLLVLIREKGMINDQVLYLVKHWTDCFSQTLRYEQLEGLVNPFSYDWPDYSPEPDSFALDPRRRDDKVHEHIVRECCGLALRMSGSPARRPTGITAGVIICSDDSFEPSWDSIPCI